jgi:hypothetical protein
MASTTTFSFANPVVARAWLNDVPFFSWASRARASPVASMIPERTNQEIITALLSLVDAIREILTEIAATGQEGNKDYTALMNTLTRLRKPS